MPRRWGWGRERSIAAAGGVAAAIAVLWSAVVSAGDAAFTTDWALIELTVRGSAGNLPLVGAPSSVGFYHPGPWSYLVLAPGYWILGGGPAALSVSVGVVNALCAGGIAWTAWRRGGLVLSLMASVVAVWMAGSQVAGTLADPWNPWMAVLPALWFLLALWSVLERDTALAPLAVVLGSFAVQAHVAYVPLLGVVVVVCGAAVLVRRRDLLGALPYGRCAVAVAVMWVLPLVEQLTSSPGNVVRLVRDGRGDGSSADSGVAAMPGILASELGWMPPWLTGDEPVEAFTGAVLGSSFWELFVPVLLLALGWWVGRGARWGLLVAASGIAGSVASVGLLEEGRAFSYVVRFAWPVAAFLWLVVVWSLVTRFTEGEEPAERRVVRQVATVALSLLVVVAGARVVAVGADGRVPVPGPDQRRVERACLDRLLPPVREAVGDAPVHLATAEFWPVMAAPILNELDREGRQVAVDEKLGFFTHLDGRATRADDVSLVVVDEDALPAWESAEGHVEIARCDLLTPDQRSQLEEYRIRLATGELLEPDEQHHALVLTLDSARWSVHRITD